MALNKWSLLDRDPTAHWWLGRVGTACGRDFLASIRLSEDADTPQCEECVAHLRYYDMEEVI